MIEVISCSIIFLSKTSCGQFSSRYFTTLSLNACSDANNVTGPPEPVPLSPDAKLSSLTVNTGPLDPAFSGDIVNYAVDVATSVSSVTVTAQPQNANASMTINGQATQSTRPGPLRLRSGFEHTHSNCRHGCEWESEHLHCDGESGGPWGE